MKITELTMSDVRAGDTRQKLGNELTLAERTNYAAQYKLTDHNPYQTKYWPLEMVLEVCQIEGIMPVLTQLGTQKVRDAGNRLHADSKEFTAAGNEVNTTGKNIHGTPQGVKAPPVAPKPATVPLVAPQEKEEAPEATTSTARAALMALVDERIDAARVKDAEGVKNLIASVASSSAGAAVEMALQGRGKEILEQAEKVGQKMLDKALAELDRARPVVIEVKRGDHPTVTLKGKVHKVFAEVLELADEREEIALIGPTGSGKTHIAQQVAEALGFDVATQFAAQSCSGGMSESKIIGGLLPTGEGGKFEPFWTDFLRLFSEGGLFLADEWDGADENVALVVNQALSNGYIDVMGLGRLLRHADFVMMVAMNTFGTGANRMYVGRNQLDEATLDRFRMGQIEMDYDRDLERDLVADLGGSNEWLRECWRIRDRINSDPGIRRNMSTRFILKGVKMMQGKEWTVEKCLSKFVMGWSESEKQKLGLAHL